jgi:CPA2 family monovalent cation:H+ antiporter-2
MGPFLYGMGVSSGSINHSAPKLLKEKDSNIWPIMGLIFARSFIVISIVLGVISTYFHLAGWAILAIFIAGLLFIFLARRSVHRFSAIEKQFMENYNRRENEEKKNKPVASSVRQKLSSYDVQTRTFSISPDCSYAGMQLKDIPIRNESGANIIKLKRGSRSITIPSGDVTVFPGDELLAVGTSGQLEQLSRLFEDAVRSAAADEAEGFTLEPVTLKEDSFLTGKSLRSTNLRKYQCMVVSVLHDNEFITNPDPDFRFSEGDTVWIAGYPSNLDSES